MRRTGLWTLVAVAVLATGMLAAGDETQGLIAVPGVEGVSAPQVLPGTQRLPVYPPAALAARFEGLVSVAAQVHADGSIGEIEIVETSHPRLGFEAAAIEALRQWQFEPARRDGQAVDSFVMFRWTFASPGTRSNPRPMVYTEVFDVAPVGKTGFTTVAAVAGAARSQGMSTLSHGGGRDAVRRVTLPPTSGTYDRRDLIPSRVTVSLPSPAR